MVIQPDFLAARILGDPRLEEISPTTCAVCLGETMKNRRMQFVSVVGLDKMRGWRFVTKFVGYFFSGKLSRQFDFGSFIKDILFVFFLISKIFVPVLCCFFFVGD